ncbi:MULTISPECIES: YbjQ family protein [Bacteroides]|uniref:YbjQ family protein n=1 Tax=Bacteroides TaxID=816 RepID=UPI002030F7EA|nr:MULTISPECIES: heavy metal-binding domain-containing protein [Bacteroides]MDV6195228.1 heavy metal-binding domain-containing protein [Bacteroides hominis (ex Liu et al. 2022)]
MNNIIITTTNNIDNATIERYIDVVSTNVVLGTNVFSDFAASFTDFFGGTSDTYQKKLDFIYKRALDIISQKAIMLGANCIIGLRIDFDEVSGKGKSMFMISATGTAVLINKQKIDSMQQTNKKNGCIQVDYLQDEIKKRSLFKKVQKGKKPTEEEWSFLRNNFVPEIAEYLLEPFLRLSKDDIEIHAQDRLFNDIFPEYFCLLNKERATELLYSYIDRYPDRVVALADKAYLFNSNKIKEEIKAGNLKVAIQLIAINKESYTLNDISEMKTISDMFDQLPDLGRIELVKGVFSKGEEKYICPNGHKNSKEEEFCNEEKCMQNIKGLTQKSVKKIEEFKLKIETLNDLLN